VDVIWIKTDVTWIKTIPYFLFNADPAKGFQNKDAAGCSNFSRMLTNESDEEGEELLHQHHNVSD
jgi:hypothetical protein